MVPQFMAKTSVVPKKKRGPPPTGKGIQVGERWHPSELAAIDAWVASSSDTTITRAHAIRRLVHLGLTVKPKAKPTGRPSAALVADLAEAIDSLGPEAKTPARPAGKPGRKLRAQELATKTIEKIIDRTAPPKERTERRRRLTKGPAEFRDARVDQHKAKGK